MNEKMISLGYGAYIPVGKICAVVPGDTDRIRKEIARRKDSTDPNGAVIDCARGRPMRSVIICENGSYYLSSLSPVTLNKRVSEKTSESKTDFEEEI